MPKRALTVLCDMDGIVVSIHQKWYDRYNERYGDELTIEKVTDWNTHLFAKHGKKVYEPLLEPGFFLDVPEIPGALEGIQTLQSAGHRVVIVTASSRFAASDKMHWWNNRAPWFSQKNLLIGYPKDLVKGDVLIDDGPHNIIDYSKAWPDAMLCAMSYPYNQHVRSKCAVFAEDWKTPDKCWKTFVEAILGYGER